MLTLLSLTAILAMLYTAYTIVACCYTTLVRYRSARAYSKR